MTGIGKPEGSSWTDEQWQAISSRGQHILVAAAAGSGKTAVLVERIIRLISSESEPVDVDRLLVATFTKAAASEMRHRIYGALEKQLAARPGSRHLRRQLALLNNASITTLHSFCMEVIKRHGSLIGLDPGLRIANETEAELLRQETLEELFEELYGESGEESSFWQLADWFSGDKTDADFLRIVLQLYDYSRSHPWPDRWLEEMAALFRVRSAESAGLSGHVWFRCLLDAALLELEGARALLERAAELCLLPGGPAPYGDNVQNDLQLVVRLLEAGREGWEALHQACGPAQFGRLKACRGEVDEELKEEVKALREEAKEKVNGLRDELFSRSPAEWAAELEGIAPLMEEMAGLVRTYAERFAAAKAEKGLLDFADLEHLSLRILLSPAAGPDNPLPSPAAEAYREQFVEVLIDEYQDTNLVQETIISLLSRTQTGNRFMVGDVKQSIYRFRLADPGLFQDKHRSFRTEDAGETEGGGVDAPPAGGDSTCARPEDCPVQGRRIDLARNFRSRQEVVDAVNFVFRQLMTGKAMEIEYDRQAELVCGAAFPPAAGDTMAAELLLIDRDGDSGSSEAGGSAGQESGEPEQLEEADDAEEAGAAQLEARLIIGRIRRMLGHDGAPPMEVYDKQAGGMRPITFRDMVVLLRATHGWASVFMEEFRQAGIPAYADLNAGYFEAVEVETVLSLLRIIDNPSQDIPLAGVLRSPMFGLNAEDLAKVRLASPKGTFYEALLHYAGLAGPPETPAAEDQNGNPNGEETDKLRSSLREFVRRLDRWRDTARDSGLPELIWSLLRETGYYDYAGGLPGGVQRQANLRALYDRARQYESTSFRGLFRFLRFVERMRDSGGDLGAARSLGEQEDVVRMMSIHKSKGLEFPVVFVAGAGKLFNMRDLNSSFLLHKELGFGVKYVDADSRISYPTLAALAVKRKHRLEMLAEEMRVLYVAMTRAREKLILTGSARRLERKLEQWSRYRDHPGWGLPEHVLASARSYLDWLGPAFMRHSRAMSWYDGSLPSGPPSRDPSRWQASVLADSGLRQAATARQEPDRSVLERIARLWPAGPSDPALRQELDRRLEWSYPYAQSASYAAKTSVTELKRLEDARRLRLLAEEAGGGFTLPDSPALQNEQSGSGLAGELSRAGWLSVFGERPRFMTARGLTAAERGTVYHAVMQQLPLQSGPVDEERIQMTLQRMVDKELLTGEQAAAVQPEKVASFFRTELGERMLRADRIEREVPFSLGVPVREVYPEADERAMEDLIFIQGVIDCVFADDAGLVLLDYKTDAVKGSADSALLRKYERQISLYCRAVEHIWQRPVDEAYLYYFDGCRLIGMKGSGAEPRS